MSDKPIIERLQVKGERRLAVIGASTALDQLIGASERRVGIDQAEVILAFAKDRAELEIQLAGPIAAGQSDAILWVAYPKLTSPLASDLNREVVRTTADSAGLETVAQIAIDEDWSAMRLRRNPT